MAPCTLLFKLYSGPRCQEAILGLIRNLLLLLLPYKMAFNKYFGQLNSVGMCQDPYCLDIPLSLLWVGA